MVSMCLKKASAMTLSGHLWYISDLLKLSRKHRGAFMFQGDLTGPSGSSLSCSESSFGPPISFTLNSSITCGAGTGDEVLIRPSINGAC